MATSAVDLGALFGSHSTYSGSRVTYPQSCMKTRTWLVSWCEPEPSGNFLEPTLPTQNLWLLVATRRKQHLIPRHFHTTHLQSRQGSPTKPLKTSRPRYRTWIDVVPESRAVSAGGVPGTRSTVHPLVQRHVGDGLLCDRIPPPETFSEYHALGLSLSTWRCLVPTRTVNCGSRGLRLTCGVVKEGSGPLVVRAWLRWP